MTADQPPRLHLPANTPSILAIFACVSKSSGANDRSEDAAANRRRKSRSDRSMIAFPPADGRMIAGVLHHPRSTCPCVSLARHARRSWNARTARLERSPPVQGAEKERSFRPSQHIRRRSWPTGGRLANSKWPSAFALFRPFFALLGGVGQVARGERGVTACRLFWEKRKNASQLTLQSPPPARYDEGKNTILRASRRPAQALPTQSRIGVFSQSQSADSAAPRDPPPWIVRPYWRISLYRTEISRVPPTEAAIQLTPSSAFGRDFHAADAVSTFLHRTVSLGQAHSRGRR